MAILGDFFEGLDDVVHAARRSCRDYPGGVSAIAAVIGVKPAVLHMKLNPRNTGHHLTLSNVVDILDATRDEEDCLLVSALCRVAGYEAVRLGDVASCSTVDGETFFDDVVAMQKELASVTEALRESIVDGVVTSDEYRLLKDRGNASIRSVALMLARVESKVVWGSGDG